MNLPPVDSATSPDRLRLLADSRPDLWPAIATHPNTPDDVRARVAALLRGDTAAQPAPPARPSAQAYTATHAEPVPDPASTPPVTAAPTPTRRPRWLIPAIIGGVAVLILAIALPLTLLGGEDTSSESSSMPIAAGERFACMIDDGSVYCWGDNTEGQLGDGSFESRSQPAKDRPVTRLSGTVQSIAATGDRACAITETGQLFCWGSGSTSADEVQGIPDVIGMTLYGAVTCAYSAAGEAWCWGANGYGQLGNGVSEDSATPQRVALDGKRVTAISAGSLHTCAVIDAREVWCWGSDTFGQLGDGMKTYEGSKTPKKTTGPLARLSVTALSAGDRSTCAVAEAEIYCWGSRHDTFDGVHEPQVAPLALPPLSASPRALVGTPGGSGGCAISRTDELLCWGPNEFGQLGLGYTSDSIDFAEKAEAVPGLTEIDSVVASNPYNRFVCAHTTDDRVHCWGEGYYGQLGNGSETDSPTPVEVTFAES